MNSVSKIAVVVVNWNSGEFLEKCLSSLKNQTLPPFRTIVVDNASTDQSAFAIESRFPNIDMVRLDKNIGFAAANNLAAKKAEDCEWIAFLNPDAFAESDWLANLLKAADKNSGYSFFGGHMRRYDGEGTLDGTGDVYHVSGLAWRRDHGLHESEVNRETGEIFAPCAAAALILREAFLEAGGFDENFFCYFEDVDLAFRLRLLGHRCLYVADAVVEHVGSATTHRHSDFAVYHGYRNLVWAYFQNMPGGLFWIYLAQHLVSNFAALVWFSLRGQARVIFKAKWDAMKEFPRVLARRRQVQKNLKISNRELRKVMAKGIALPYMRGKRSV